MPSTWTYDSTDLTDEKNRLRLEVGDTDSGAWLLSDQEYQYAITQERNFWAAAARCCELAGTLFMRRVDVRLGRAMQIMYAKTAQQYFDRARLLRCKAMGTVVPYVGGARLADKLALEQDTSLVAPAFTRTMQENPWTGGYNSDSLAPVANSPNPDEE